MTNEINPIIYVLIERAERELDTKLLTALYLLKKGFHVILGHQWALTENSDVLPIGLFFFKGMNRIHVRKMGAVRQLGHAVVSSEEEQLDNSINPPDSHCNFYLTYHKDAWRHSQLFLAKHESEIKVIRDMMPELPVLLTGNSRTDSLRPELLPMYYPMRDGISKAISSSFILVNTNTSMVNSSHSPDILADLAKEAGPDGKESAVRYKEWEELENRWERYNLKSICELIGLFGQYSPDQKVIIRPHPAESPDIYKRLSGKYRNIEVASNQESVRPWILASDILIHTGCTTGAEAVAMNHPTISIQEKDSEHIRFRVSNNVSHLTHTAAEAYQAVQGFYADKLKLGDNSKLKKIWPAQEGKFAAERIADGIHGFYLDLDGLFNDFELALSGNFKQVRLTDFYKAKMFVELSQVEQILRQIYQQLPTMPQMKLYEISRNVFYMRPS